MWQRSKHASEPQALACAVSGRRPHVENRLAAQAKACGSVEIHRANAVILRRGHLVTHQVEDIVEAVDTLNDVLRQFLLDD